ncbi:MAG TPA: thioredoxin domain-containing protein [Acidobacteriaceae bacterium]
MLKLSAPLRLLPLLFAMSTVGCHAQSKELGPVQAGQKLNPEETRRVEVMIRSRSQMPADYKIQIGVPKASDISGFETLPISYTSPQGSTRNIEFLISNDGKTLAQMNRFDLSADPKDIISVAGRPARGGPENAPVLIVGFDDLECPFCAEMHAELFPALLKRYKDQVRIVYRDFPLDQHPWAVRAAVDSNCLGTQSATAYWNYVDYVHAHAAEMGGTEKSLEKAKQSLDKIALDEGTKNKLDQPTLTACILKQDATKVSASVLDGESDALRVGSTPTYFVNGEKIEGVTSLETFYAAIDRALVAAGQTPPPAPPAPGKAAPAAAPATAPSSAAPAAKPGT